MPPEGENTESLGSDFPGDLIWTEHRPGAVLAGRYTIVQRVGSGGYATVYLAEDALLRRRVAVKVLHPNRVAGHGLARLRREVLVARAVRDPHLVEIHDLVVEDGVAFLTMEWVEGETLQERLRRGGPFDVDEAVPIAREILAGMAALHERGILHRDVKPSNILLAKDGTVKLLDFGLALHWAGTDTRITATEAVVGTAEYLSPEQILGERVGPPADLYAFGVTLFEMLCGTPAFGKGTSFQTILRRLERGPSTEKLREAETPAWLEQIVLRLLERRPEDRFRGVEEVLARLETQTSTWVTPRRRRVGRRATLAVLGGVLVAALVWAAFGAEPELSHVAWSPRARSLIGVAEDGSRLWTLEGVNGELALARLRPGEPERLVGTLYPHGSWDPERTHRLVEIEPRSGETIRVVELAPTSHFSEFSNDFRPSGVLVRDLDADGYDEVMVTYVHRYWPSYTYLYEPRIERQRTLFVASGHHRPRGFLDVTGDGHPEVLFVGWANRIGYGMGMAAVSVRPWVNESPDQRRTEQAHTPDPHLWRAPSSALVWYSLLPHDACLDRVRHCFEIEGETIRVQRPGETWFELDGDGFPRSTDSPLAPSERLATKRDTWNLLTRARMTSQGGAPSEAQPLATRGIELAERVGDPLLEEYARRVEARILARAGRLEEAGERFGELLDSSEIPSNVAFEAAEAFHLQGVLDRAIAWYYAVFREHPVVASGRPLSETLTGLVLAHLERHEYREALAAVERLESDAGLDRSTRTGVLRHTIRWLAGWSFETHPWIRDHPDIHRYLTLELDLAGGVPLTRVLERVDAELEIASDTNGLVLSLAGEIARRQGRREAALTAASEAYAVSLQQVAEHVHYRPFLPLVADRYAEILERAGRLDEAREVRDRAEAALRGLSG